MSKSPVIGIVAKTSHPRAEGLVAQLLKWIESRGYSFHVDAAVFAACGSLLDKSARSLPREELGNHCDILVVMGGDGTFISASRHPYARPPIIIGVNLGTLGFLTEITVEELFISLESAISGSARIETRNLLECAVSRGGKVHFTSHAINDVVVGKEALARIFAIDLKVDGDQAAVLRGDGVIISTPLGSTTYSLASGGSIVHPEVNALLVTPICPHSLTSRPLVLPKKSSISLRIASDHLSDINKVYLTLDGQEGLALENNDEVIVTTSDFIARIVRSPSKNYFEVLGTKLKWAKH